MKDKIIYEHNNERYELELNEKSCFCCDLKKECFSSIDACKIFSLFSHVKQIKKNRQFYRFKKIIENNNSDDK